MPLIARSRERRKDGDADGLGRQRDHDEDSVRGEEPVGLVRSAELARDGAPDGPRERRYPQGRRPPPGTQSRGTLTPRNIEILALVAGGLSNAEFGERVFLAEGTVKWHMRKILRALDVSNRAQAVARYRSPEPPRPV